MTSEYHREHFLQGTASRLAAVRQRIEDAAKRSGRTESDVTLVAVTKYVSGREGLEEALLAAGSRDFGENRPQNLLEKIQILAEESERTSSPAPADFASIRWHFIGSLQRNKVRRILPYVSLIHSVDTPDLFNAINRILDEENEKPAANNSPSPQFPAQMPILLEVNISGEGNKHGFQPEGFLDQAAPLLENPGRTVIRGLMGMGGLQSTASEVRNQFASLRRLFEECRAAFPNLSEFTELSMGMSHDFEIAIEEGATLVRVGSLLYPDKF